jgi:pyridoxamine 5'-phosphate oxidase
MIDPSAPESLEEIEAHVFALLARGVADRRHGFHQPTLATIGRNGMPKSRIVILRGVDRAARSVRFHTDSRSEKIAELTADPKASLNFYDSGLRQQVRAEGRAILHHGDNAARRFWDASQRMSRICYGTAPAPGSVIDAPDAFTLPEAEPEIAGGFAHFVAVEIALSRLEWLFLRHQGHRRAELDLGSGGARWFAP